MGKRKRIIIFTMIIMIGIFISLFLYERGNKDANVNPIFADNYISSMIKDASMSFNVFGIRKVGKKGNLMSEVISDIEFNNKNININSFSIDEGLIKDGFQLFNFIIDVEVSGDNVEKADQLTIYFTDNTVESYNIGDVTLQKDKGYQKEDIELSNEFTIGYPAPSLDIDVMNNNKDTITLKKINDLNNELVYHFGENTELKHQESYNILVPSFEQEKNYDFYTITPILQYTKNSQDNFLDLPDVIYGILISDEEKIQRIVDGSM